MECYIINHSKPNEKTYSRNANDSVSVAELNSLEKNCEGFIKKLKFEGKNNIKFYCSTNVRAKNVLSVFSTKFFNNKLVAENGIIIDPIFNGRNYGELARKSPDDKISTKELLELAKANLNVSNKLGIEKKKDYENRVFDAMASIVMENEKNNNQVIVLIVNDEFIKTCQQNKDISSMFYFGDEAYWVPSTTKIFYNQYSHMLDFEHKQSYIDFVSKPSKKDFASLKPEKVILEKPQISSFNEVKPVYEKYIGKEIEAKLEKQNAIKGEKVW